MPVQCKYLVPRRVRPWWDELMQAINEVFAVSLLGAAAKQKRQGAAANHNRPPEWMARRLRRGCLRREGREAGGTWRKSRRRDTGLK